MWYFSWMLGLPLAVLLSIVCVLACERYEDKQE